jgi:Mn-dependent DtxR family transcriptional regulator/diadenosine tetraphosphate (Ap4A) HIT family hydrolase
MALRFDPDLLPRIRDGKVTMQFGLWRRPRVVAGRVYVVKGLGIVRVTAVEKIDLSRLTPWEAEAAGAKGVEQLREWLKLERPDVDPTSGNGYRVRFRYLGPETNDGEEAEEMGEEDGDEEDDEEQSRSAVPPKAVPPDLMEWVDKRPWRLEHLQTLVTGIWRNADDIAAEVKEDSPTTRRRMGDLRKRDLVTSHRHHGYRITPEGQGALTRTVDGSADGVGTSAAGWLNAKGSRSDIIEALRDGRWHNAGEIGEILKLSVVSIQRRVAALRDRGLIESHRRRGYRLTEVGREAAGITDEEPTAEASAFLQAVPEEGPWGLAARVHEPMELDPTVPEPHIAEVPGAEVERVAPIPSSLLEWLDKKDYRKDLMLAIPPGDYISSSELSELLDTSITALHGRLKTLKEKDLVTALPRRGYKVTNLGTRVAAVLRAMAMRSSTEPEGASAFLSAEPPGWGALPQRAVPTVAPQALATMQPRSPRWGSGTECGFCHADASSLPRLGWVVGLQSHLESPLAEGSSEKPMVCRRGIIEDASWFLVLERNPLAEGHCKLICKEHVWDLLELGEWANRDQRIAAVRDSMSRALVQSVEVIMALDPRIVDVMIVSGLEHGSHLHLDLIPRYRMDLPGLRPLASSRAFYDDLSLVRKRRLWETRRRHLEEVANKLRSVSSRVLATRSATGTRVTTFGEL